MVDTEARTGSYTYDQAWGRERERLEALADIADPGTQRHLVALGLRPDARCLEVGAGAGTIARWLAGTVAPDGQVVATDIDPRHFESLHGGNVEVRRHDITTDALERDHYDLVHSRMVLQHVPQREAVLLRLVAALRPGGWLLLEDIDFGPPVPEVMARYAREDRRDVVLAVLRAFHLGMTANGADNSFGARLPALMIDAGLVDVGGELRAPLRLHRPGKPHWGALSLLQVRDSFVAAGLLDAQTADVALAAIDGPDAITLNVPLMAVWGRKAA